MSAVRRIDRLDLAVQALAALHRSRSPSAPLAPEWVLVQSRLLGQWLCQQVAAQAGACCGISWLLPEDFLGRCLRLAGVPPPPEQDPWRKEVLAWRVRALLPGLGGAPAAYAARGDGQAWQLAARLADCLDTWQLTRPAWIAAWEAGRPVAELAGQPEATLIATLWRQLAGQAGAGPSRCARVQAARAGLGRPAGGGPAWVGAVLCGPLPTPLLDLLDALDRPERPVLALVLAGSLRSTALSLPRERAAALDEAPAGHRLAAALGGQQRRWDAALDGRPGWEADPQAAGADPGGDGLLGALRRQLACDRDPEAPLPWSASDRSLRVHRCPGEMREAEVLREELLRAFAEIPDLEPQQVQILVPDLAAYAPLIRAALVAGGGELDPALAEAAPVEEDPCAAAALALLRFAQGDQLRSEGLALLDLPAVQAALGLDAGRCAVLRRLLDRAGLSADLDVAQRLRRLGLPEATGWEPGTWAWACERLLRGWILGRVPEALVGDTAPDTALLGAWLAWWESLAGLCRDWPRPRPPATWAADLRGHFARLLGDPSGALALSPLLARLDALAAAAAWCEVPVEPGTVLDLLAAALEGSAPRPGALDGRIRLGGFAPLRGIPARVTAILGMSERCFPRHDPPPAYDLAAACAWQPGERDPRADDRQLFLDAVRACSERLIICAPAGLDRGDRSEPTPFSPCVQELLAACAELGAPEGGLVVDQPLTPHSPRYRDPARAGELRSHDRVAAAVAEALERPGPAAVFAPAQVAAAPSGSQPWELDELTRCLANPAAAWLRRDLGFSERREAEEPADEDPLDLDGRQRWQAMEAMLAALAAGGSCASGLAGLQAAGALPLGRQGAQVRQGLLAQGEDFCRRAGLAPGLPPRLALAIPGLHGVIPGRVQGGVLRTWYNGSSLDRARVRIALRLRQLLAVAAQPSGEDELTVLAVLRDGDKELDPIGDPTTCAAALSRLMAIAEAARRQPIPFLPATTWARWRVLAKEGDELAMLLAAQTAWAGGDFQRAGTPPPEREQEGIRLVWRGRDPFSAEEWPALCALGDEVWSLLEGGRP